MKKTFLLPLLLGALLAGCKKEIPVLSPTETVNQKLQATVWKANRFYNATDTFESDYKLIATAFWSFEEGGILRQSGWLMADPITLKDELLYTYQLEADGSRIRSRYAGFEEDDVWQIVKLTPDTLTVKRLAPLFPTQQPAYLEFLPSKKPNRYENRNLLPTPLIGIHNGL